MTLRLDQTYRDGAKFGALVLRLHNLGDAPLRPVRLCYASMTRPANDVAVTGGSFRRRFANHVEVDAAPSTEIAPGEVWEVVMDGLTHAPKNRTQGVLAAWIETADGDRIEAEIGELQPAPGQSRGPQRDYPEGEAALPYAVLPWPATVACDGRSKAAVLVPAADAPKAPFAAVAALHRRLFPVAPQVISLDPVEDSATVTVAKDGALPAGGYALAFDGAAITLRHSDAEGLRHGLITLAQMSHAAQTDSRFALPESGTIEDAPRHGWRGCHIDVARNFRDAEKIARFVDILAWHKLNRMHWHLTDDEGWRLPIPAYPDLAERGGKRGPGTDLDPQYADGPKGQEGRYTVEEVKALVAQGESLGVTLMPEIDTPGHVTALLKTIPGLLDPEEPEDSYRSVQGYPNNALNPALPKTYEVMEVVIDALCDLFPSEVLHMGGDEVDKASWAQSPAAQALREEKGLDGTMGLQSYFLRRVQEMIAAKGRRMGGWDECAEGEGIDPENGVIFAWQKVESVAAMIEDGYDVVAMPGQAYYFDMVQGEGWDAPGAAWAGTVSPKQTYDYEATAGLPEGPGRLIGVEGAIWTETIYTTERFNEMVFPRLSALAEAGWSPAEAKDWTRFCALSRLMPQL
ncbi:beta-N-acetylhexosaminidase [Pseudoroseicyclus aestuarii]|uniref:beta-N-acetylhexosaminidase n=1 Tax=Pseudoroseicyclus aestuarii TaxID=1795041 RepID=A0A318SVN9_9RHOB|nr:beta-N-acetylhexosaminidase [Pseudoroseicyclus aestuarii]PYE85673.1 hexosaminidase [Pseudoroseicyclus aestuarii]